MDDVINPKDIAKVGLADALRFANEHLSPAEMAKEVYGVLGDGSIPLSNQIVLLIAETK